LPSTSEQENDFLTFSGCRHHNGKIPRLSVSNSDFRIVLTLAITAFVEILLGKQRENILVKI